MVKITFIGAGSIVFARNILTDILTFPEMRKDVVLCLEDIDEHRLDLMYRYMKKYIDDNEPLHEVKVEKTLDQRKAVKDAKFIINAVQIGGLDAYKVDLDIPYKYGIHQVVGDSLGPGGVFRFLRTTSFFSSLLKDIAEVGEFGSTQGVFSNGGNSPLLLNYTNPMAMNTWYCNALYADSTVGLCHGVQGTAGLLKKYIGAMNDKEFHYMAAGINHMAWFLKLWYKDPFEDPELKGPWKDAYPIIAEHLREEPEIAEDEKIRIDMYRATGYFMTESSGHLSEYLPFYLKRKDLIQKYASKHQMGFESLIQGYYYKENIKKLEKNDEEFDKNFEREKIPMKQTPSQEYGASIIRGIHTNTPFLFNGNVINKDGSLIINLPKNCCVEVPTTADGTGLHPQGGIELPDVCAALCLTNINVQRLAVKGALDKNRELIFQAVMMDPNTQSVLCPEEIRSMVDEMFDAEKKWLPNW
jgi:alpha-galactosidase